MNIIRTSDNLSVVFVDDDKFLVELFRCYVKMAHPKWKVKYFSDSIKALEFIERNGNNIGVVICDVKMPFMSGPEILALVKDKFPKILRVTLSGQIDSRTIIDAGKTAECSLCKPLKGETLCNAIIELVGVRNGIAT